MPKRENPKLVIRLDLLKPQSDSEKLPVKLIRWLLSSGRFIFVFVEALVLIAFIARFKLDADLSSNKEAIEQQIPYIESLKGTETSVKEAQLKLSTIDSFYSSYADYSQILKKIAAQTPAGVKIISMNLQKNVAEITIQLNARAQSNIDLVSFLTGLKQDPSFSDINITGIGFEKGSLSFSLSAQALASLGGKI